jgi:hypothetical protein
MKEVVMLWTLLEIAAWWGVGSLIGGGIWCLAHWNRPILIDDWTDEGRGAPFR